MKWSENMTERENLLAILHDMPEVQTLNETADYLLKHGVTISTLPSTELVERRTVIEKLNNIGGCDAKSDSWADGWDKAIDTAIAIVEKMPVGSRKKGIKP